jgi:hypothetical protein
VTRSWLARLRCRSARRLAWEEIDGRLAASRRDALRRHLSACADCAAFLEQARRLDGALAAGTALQPSAEFDRRLFQRLAAAGGAHPGAASRSAREDGDPMTRVDWALLGGMIAFAVAAVAAGLWLVLKASGGAPAAGGDELGIARVLSVAVQAPVAAIDETSRGLLRHPLAAPILMAAGLLGVTLGWIRVVLARPAS